MLALLALAIPPTSRALAAPGDLDPYFSTDGFAFAPFGELEQGPVYRTGATATEVAVQDDGKVVVMAGVSYANSECVPHSIHFCNPVRLGHAIARFNADGSLDRSFAGKGQLEIRSPYTTAHAIAVQDDGRILLAAGAAASGSRG